MKALIVILVLTLTACSDKSKDEDIKVLGEYSQQLLMVCIMEGSSKMGNRCVELGNAYQIGEIRKKYNLN